MAKRRSPARFKGHRAFAWLWDKAVRRESAREREMRRYAAGGAHGRILEIGAGVGTNRDYLPADAAYIGIEPDPHMRRRAVERAHEEGREPAMVAARAEALPFADGSFDVVLVTLTFCSVQAPARAAREIRRVLRPDGELRFFEHVRPRNNVLATGADIITPAWKRIGGGCHPNRRTLRTFEAAGFVVQERREFTRAGAPMVAGSARLAAAPPSSN